MADHGGAQLLSGGHDSDRDQTDSLLTPKPERTNEEDDIQPINGVAHFAGEFFIESKKLWHLAGPAIFTSFCQYGLITTTQILAGHLGTTQLAAVSIENSIISGFPFGMMVINLTYSLPPPLIILWVFKEIITFWSLYLPSKTKLIVKFSNPQYL